MKATADAELDELRGRYHRADQQANEEHDKQRRYCQQQCDLLRVLDDLNATERTMYELDHRKDQLMTVCKLMLTNLGMWVRDQYFPASYAHATWDRLAPFFRLPGDITRGEDCVTVKCHLSFKKDRFPNNLPRCQALSAHRFSHIMWRDIGRPLFSILCLPPSSNLMTHPPRYMKNAPGNA